MSLFDPIQPLKLSDTFYNWWETTNEISAALNPLNIYDVASGPGITISRITDGVAVISVNIGCGLRYDENISLSLDIQNLPEVSQPDELDNYIIELGNSTNTTPSSTDCETFRRVEATNILPFTVSGDHDFTGGTSSSINFSSSSFTVESVNTHLKSNSIKIGNASSTPRSSISSIGFKIDALDEDPSWIYRGDLLAWYTNQNIGISYDQAFVSEGSSGSSIAKFNFSPKGATQTDTEINLLLGSRTTEIVNTDTDEAISIRALDSTNQFSVSHVATNGIRTTLFHTSYDPVSSFPSGTNGVDFYFGGRIYVAQLQLSAQFRKQPGQADHSDISSPSPFVVPITTDSILNYGRLDFKYTNRVSILNSSAPGLAVGDAVRLSGSTLVKAQADTEENSNVLGMVESIDTTSGYTSVVLGGLFQALLGSYSAGSTYYLSQTTAGVLTSTKPTTGIVKPILVGLYALYGSYSYGIMINSSQASQPYFSNIQISGGDTIDADSVGDTLTFIAGSNVTIDKNTNNEIIISAGSLSDADYFSSIVSENGTISADIASDSFNVEGMWGIYTFTAGDTLYIRGSRGFSTIQVIGENTNELDYTVSANVGEDTLYLRSGIGINITSTTDNDILIEATGVSVPADGSITNAKLSQMTPFSIKGAQADGLPTDIYDIEERLYFGGYVVTGTGTLSDPKIYTENKPGGETFTSLVSLSGETVLGTAPNQQIAGYVFGRWTDQTGTVSEIIPLGRTELRSIIGASSTGFLEENSNLFNSWYIYTSSGSQKSSAIADQKTGKLVFQEGNNITLTKTTTGEPDNEICIKIDAASSLSGFNSIINNRTGQNIQSGDTSGVLELKDDDAIAIEVDSNNGLSFTIKPESITNSMLANMPFNSVKVSIQDTDEPNPVDLQIGMNEILGRTSGNLKSLNSTEVKQILGLSSSYYFNSVSLQDSGGTTIPDSTITASSGAESFALRAGNNISLNKISGQNIYVINSTGGSTSGLTKIVFSDVDGAVYDNPQTLQFSYLSLDAPSGFGTQGAYRNIEFVPSFNNGTVVANVDLALMPEYSVKIASNTSTTRNGSSGHVAANYVLGQNEVLTRLTGNSLSGSLVNNLLNQSTGGIPYITQFGNATNLITPNNGSNTLRLTAGTNVTINNPTYSSNTINYTINSQTVLSTDPSPTLGADLDVNNFYFTYTSLQDVISPVLKLTQTHTSNASLFNFLITHSDSASTITLERFAGSTATRDLTIAGFGSSSGVIINRIKSSTVSTPIELASASNVSTATTSNRHIILSSAAAEVLVGAPQASSNSKTLVFVSSAGSVAANSANIRCRFYNGASPTATLIGDLVFAATGTTVGIGTTCAGNMILCANGGPITAGSGLPNAGAASIQFNSDLLMSGKSIRAVNNNITIDTFTNDFTGALVVKATNKSGFHRVKSGTRLNSDASSKILETISTTGSYTEKFAKYMLYMQSTVDATCAVVEFNVLANGSSARALNVVSVIVSDVNGDLSNAQNIDGVYEIVKLSTASGTITTNPNETITPSQALAAACNTNNPTETGSTFLIQFNNCLQQNYNYTLYKMSIQA